MGRSHPGKFEAAFQVSKHDAHGWSSWAGDTCLAIVLICWNNAIWKSSNKIAILEVLGYSLQLVLPTLKLWHWINEGYWVEDQGQFQNS